MKTLFLLLTTLYHIALYGQSLDSLDVRRGFKQLHFGINRSVFKNMEPTANNKYFQANEFYYHGGCCRTAFGFQITDISVEFNEYNLLNSISIVIEDINYGQNEEIYKSIIYKFGGETNKKIDKTRLPYKSIYEWIGKKVKLTYCWDISDKRVYLIFESLENLKPRQNMQAKNDY